MSKLKKLYEHILMRRSDANVPFETLCSLLKRLGFDERMKWEHHIFTKDGVDEIIIFWSSEDNAFVADVPELSGCMAGGKTYQEALSNAEQIIDEWIETATRLGRPIPQPKGRLAYA